jgi:hypothetical protein
MTVMSSCLEVSLALSCFHDTHDLIFQAFKFYIIYSTMSSSIAITNRKKKERMMGESGSIGSSGSPDGFQYGSFESVASTPESSSKGKSRRESLMCEFSLLRLWYLD